MASLHTLPRTGLWLCLSLCLLLAATPSEAATRKYVKTPDTSAVLTSTNSSYLSGNNLWVKGDSMTSYIDRLGKKTPVGGIVPKRAFSIPSVGTKLKTFLKGNLAQVAMSAAISGAIGAVGWVMSDDNTKVQKKELNVNGEKAAESSVASPDYLCSLPAAQTMGKIWVITASNGTQYAAWTGYMSQAPSGYSQFANNCTSSSLGYAVNWNEQPLTGTIYPVVQYKVLRVGELSFGKVDLTDSDWSALDNYVTVQNSEWLRTILRDTCAGSLNPAKCFAELAVAAQQLEGPATLDGGTTTKTSTYTRPDGAMGTQVEQQKTAFALNYGPDYFDYTTTTTTTQTQDGTKTSESTQTDSPEVTQEEPKDDTQQDDQKQEEPKREFSGDECEAPILCSGDAIDCAMVRQEKSLRCAYEKQSDYEKNQDKIKAAVAGQKFEIDDSSEIEIPSFINQGTRFLPAACPADKSFSLKTGGGRSFVLTYEPLCAAATDLGYLIVVAVGVFCVLYVGRSLGGE